MAFARRFESDCSGLAGTRHANSGYGETNRNSRQLADKPNCQKTAEQGGTDGVEEEQRSGEGLSRPSRLRLSDLPNIFPLHQPSCILQTLQNIGLLTEVRVQFENFSCRQAKQLK